MGSEKGGVDGNVGQGCVFVVLGLLVEEHVGVDTKVGGMVKGKGLGCGDMAMDESESVVW